MGVKLIHSTDKPEPKKYRARNHHESEPILCPKCNGSIFIEIVSSPLRKKGRRLMRSGEKKLICQSCSLRGKTVIVD